MNDFTIDLFIDTVIFTYAIILGKFFGVVVTTIVTVF